MGGIGVAGQDARSAVSPAEHVGKHSNGVSGCFAVSDNGGIAEGVTPTLGGDGELAAQPVSASSIESSVGFSRSELGILSILVPLLLVESALRFLSVRLVF